MDIKDALAEYMREHYRLDVERVVDFYDDTESGGYCDTCYYEWAVVRVNYLDSNDEIQKWTYSGSFTELVRDL